MKAFVCMMALAVGTAHAQTVHAVTPGAKGNTIELAIVNDAALENVCVKFMHHSEYLTIGISEQTINAIAPAKGAMARVSFDVARSAPIDRQDTLLFRITDERGNLWSKEVILRYTGPTVFALDQNYPNPFNPSTRIQYQLPVDSRVSLKVYDMLGREVATLVDEERPAGYHDVKWFAANSASGVYFYRMEAEPLNGGNRFQSVRRLMILK